MTTDLNFKSRLIVIIALVVLKLQQQLVGKTFHMTLCYSIDGLTRYEQHKSYIFREMIQSSLFDLKAAIILKNYLNIG